MNSPDSAGTPYLVRSTQYSALRIPYTELARLCQKPDHRTVGNWMARRMARPLALHVTRVVAPWGVTAHMATFAAWAIGLAAAGCFGGGSVGWWLAAAGLLQLWYLLDHVDGQLARLRGTESLDGAALDYLMHHTLNLLVPIGVGWGLAGGGRSLWLLAGIAWGVGLLMIGLVNDVRYKAFIKRLKRLDGELRVIGGSGASPMPPTPMPRRLKALATWLARKACEPHVIMNTLTLVAVCQWLAGDVALTAGRVYLASMAPLSIALAGALIWRSLRQQAAESEFAAWYRAVDDDWLQNDERPQEHGLPQETLKGTKSVAASSSV
jgi:phosphatidylglycerophosphate synthase